MVTEAETTSRLCATLAAGDTGTARGLTSDDVE
jgi:hypothetical protein